MRVKFCRFKMMFGRPAAQQLQHQPYRLHNEVLDEHRVYLASNAVLMNTWIHEVWVADSSRALASVEVVCRLAVEGSVFATTQPKIAQAVSTMRRRQTLESAFCVVLCDRTSCAPSRQRQPLGVRYRAYRRGAQHFRVRLLDTTNGEQLDDAEAASSRREGVIFVRQMNMYEHIFCEQVRNSTSKRPI